jgi:hypothetical protein
MIPSPILAVVIPWRNPVPLGPTTEIVVDCPAASDAGVTEVRVIGPEEATRNPPAKIAVSVPVLAVMVYGPVGTLLGMLKTALMWVASVKVVAPVCATVVVTIGGPV